MKISEMKITDMASLCSRKLIKVIKMIYKKTGEIEYFAEFKKDGTRKIDTIQITELDYITMKDIVKCEEYHC